MPGETIKRKLTTILAADVAGYSRMMAADEEAVLLRLKAYRTIFDQTITRHQGRVFNTAGDSIVAEFDSAVEALRCAIAVQEDLAARNAALPEDQRMAFRIGVNVGDVMVDGENLFGDGVNVAARLEGIAQPGGICISGSTFEQVKNKLSIGFEDMGPQSVKNIPYPVPAFRITPGPVTVVANPAETAEGGTTRGGSGWRRAVAAGVLVIAAGAGLAYWLLLPPAPRPLSSFPAHAATDEMHADDVAAFIAGMTIHGKRLIDGVPFTIELHADKTLDYRFGPPGQPEVHEVGQWQANDFGFCFRVRAFNQHRESCPRIIKEGDRLTATRPNGAQLGWTLQR